MMFWIPKAEAIKAAWPAILLVVLAVAVMVIGAMVTFRGCSRGGGDDYLDDTKRAIIGEVEHKLSENGERMKGLEADLYDLRAQVEALDAEAQASAEEREEIHDALENAATIDDVDRILRAGLAGSGGRRPR